jgi:hypothetical protein
LDTCYLDDGFQLPAFRLLSESSSPGTSPLTSRTGSFSFQRSETSLVGQGDRFHGRFSESTHSNFLFLCSSNSTSTFSPFLEESRRSSLMERMIISEVERDSNDCLEPHEYRPRGRWKSSIVNFRTPLQKQIILFTLRSHVEPTAESPYPTIGFDGD